MRATFHVYFSSVRSVYTRDLTCFIKLCFVCDCQCHVDERVAREEANAPIFVALR